MVAKGTIMTQLVQSYLDPLFQGTLNIYDGATSSSCEMLTETIFLKVASFIEILVIQYNIGNCWSIYAAETTMQQSKII